MACSPTLVAHLSLAATDGCATLTVLAMLLTLERYLRVRSSAPVTSIGAYAALAVSLGCALAAKYSPGPLLVVALTMFVGRAPDVSRAQHAWRAVRTGASLLVIALGVAWVWHGLGTAPLVTPAFRTRYEAFAGAGPLAARGWATLLAVRVPSPIRGFVVQLNHDFAGHEAFLLGARSRVGWWYYGPVVLALKSTPVELTLMVGSFVVLALRGRHASPAWRVGQAAVGVLIVSTAAAHLDLGVRYLLPLYPIAALIGLTLLRARLSPRLWRVAGVTLLAGQVWSAASVAPHQLSYVSALWGGPARAGRLLADSNLDWGQDLPALEKTLRRVGAERPLVSYFGTAPFSAYDVRATPWTSASDAERVQPDWVAISVTHLDGLYVEDDPFASFRALTPNERAGFSVLLFDARQPGVSQAIAAASARLR
jgi:hypothetical protein